MGIRTLQGMTILLPVLLTLRFGIIGTDTSHAAAFTKALNEMGHQVVAAYKGGSPDIEESASRVDKYASELQTKWGVKIVDKISDLCSLVDGLLLESVDGRPHLAQFREAVQCGKPVFIDKPLASTVEDAKEIDKLAKEKHIPWFSSSSLRYGQTAELKSPDAVGAMVWGPGPTEPHHTLEMTWYGIHAVEMIYTLLGPGCVDVSATKSGDEDVSGWPLERRQAWYGSSAKAVWQIWGGGVSEEEQASGGAGYCGGLRAAGQRDCHVHADEEASGAE